MHKWILCLFHFMKNILTYDILGLWELIPHFTAKWIRFSLHYENSSTYGWIDNFFVYKSPLIYQSIETVRSMRAYQFMNEKRQAFRTMRATKLTGHSVHESLKIFGSTIPWIFDEKVSIYEWIERRFRSWELIYPRTNRDRRFGPWERQDLWVKQTRFGSWELEKSWIYDTFDFDEKLLIHERIATFRSMRADLSTGLGVWCLNWFYEWIRTCRSMRADPTTD